MITTTTTTTTTTSFLGISFLYCAKGANKFSSVYTMCVFLCVGGCAHAFLVELAACVCAGVSVCAVGPLTGELQ